MSRIGKKAINIPSTTLVNVEAGKITVSDKFGTLEKNCSSLVNICKENNYLHVFAAKNTRESKSLQGLYRVLIQNMITGVCQKFSKRLIANGVGFKFSLGSGHLILSLGFTHPIKLNIPKGLTVDIESASTLKISGADKEEVGLFSSQIKAYRPVEPYKARGIQYENEKIRRKAGKTGK